MSRKSDSARQKFAYDIDYHGLKRTQCEKKRFLKSKRKKKLQKKARKTNRK